MNFITNLKIGARLGLGFGLVLLLLVAVAGLGLSRMSQINAAVNDITQANNPETRLAVEMRLNINRVGAAIRDLVLLTDEAEMKAVQAGLLKNRADYDAAEEKLGRMFDTMADTTPKEKELFAKIKELKSQSRPINSKVMELGLANKAEEATKVLMKEALPAQRAWLVALGELADLEDKLNNEAASAAEQTYASARTLLLSLTAIALGLGIAAAILITRTITAPISQALQMAKTVASGDLTSSIEGTSSDETGQLLSALKAMQTSLTDVVGTVRQGSEALTTASAEIAQGNHDLSARTESQASSLEQTAASMEQLSATVKQNADNAHQANQLAQSASTTAMQGGKVVASVVETMKDINDSSRKISDIISVIDGIAFQTNILALNAAVEAARAGDQGRGFAVVASEVRSLAGRSADAAKEIKRLINASVERVELGTTQVDQAGNTMDEAVRGIKRVTDLMGEISAASNEQSLGVSQVGEAVMQKDQVTQQNAALVEEMAAAASSLKSQAQELVETVTVFKLGDKASHPAMTSQAAVRTYRQPGVAYKSLERRVSAAPSPERGNASNHDINLDSAIKAHADWRATLRSAANKSEQVDAQTIGRDDCCVLGKWLHGAGNSKFGGKPTFVALTNGHREFHTEAGKVARAINQGAGSQAEKMLGSGTPFAHASGEVGRLIIQIKKEISGAVKPVARQTTARPVPFKLTSQIAVVAGQDADWESF
jgi:methyl-accepting chemotaxis protein